MACKIKTNFNFHKILNTIHAYLAIITHAVVNIEEDAVLNHLKF